MPQPDADSIWQWLLAMAALLWIAKLTLDLWRTHLRVPDQIPPLHEVYATRRSLDQTNAALSNLATATDTRFTAIARSSSEGREKIYGQVNNLREEVAGLRAQNATQAQILDRHDRKLDTILERLPNKPNHT